MNKYKKFIILIIVIAGLSEINNRFNGTSMTAQIMSWLKKEEPDYYLPKIAVKAHPKKTFEQFLIERKRINKVE